MKNILIILGLFVSAGTYVLAADVVDYLRARSTGAAVVIEWRSTSEADITRYEIERAGDDGIFRYVATLDVKGSNQTYDFTDNEAFGKPDGSKVAANYFTYRLKLVHADKSVTYSNTAGVTHSVSSIKRTWGMIKQMFR
jgi:opacity protein-like surface antigen